MLKDNLMDNSNMAMLTIEPESGSPPCTIITVLPVIKPSVGI